MSDLSKLSIYDNPVQSRPVEQPVANIYDVSDRVLYKVVFGPIKCAKYHLTKWGNQAVDHVTSPMGMAQGASLGVAVLLGRKFGNRLLPMVAGKTYTIPFKVAHKTLAFSVPWATACAWFETPRSITWSVATATGSGIAMTLSGIWSTISFTFSFLWNLMTASPEDIPKQADTTQEETPETTEKSEVPQLLNETEVETDLKSRKRHAEDEIEIKANIVGESTLLIEEDPGQASEEDKDLYPPRRES